MTTKNEKSEGCKELEVLNFIIERRHDGQIENVIPIENKTAMLFCRTIELFCLLGKKIFQSFHKVKIRRLFARKRAEVDTSISIRKSESSLSLP